MCKKSGEMQNIACTEIPCMTDLLTITIGKETLCVSEREIQSSEEGYSHLSTSLSFAFDKIS